MNRRRLLSTAVGTVAVAVAGCAEGNNASSGETEDDVVEPSEDNETESEQVVSGSICETVMETSHYERQSQSFEVGFNQYIRVSISNTAGFRTRVTLNHEEEGFIFGESVESDEEQLFRVHDPDHEYGIVEELTGAWEVHYEPHNNESDTYGYAKIQVCDGAFDLEQ